jgi:hypothetical protein
MMAMKSKNPKLNRFPDTARRLAIVLLTALSAGGCAGGSGSSGFITEAAVIQSVLDEGRCMDLDGLQICPAGAAQIDPTEIPVSPAPSATPTIDPADIPSPMPTDTPGVEGTPALMESPTPTSTATPTSTTTPTETTIPGMGVDLVMAPTIFENCDSFAIDGVCLVLQLVTRGFDHNARFYLAVRSVGSDEAWDIVAPIAAGDGLGSPALDAAVPIHFGGPANSGDASALQIVVLAFFNDPGFVPERIDRLADSGADLAFAVAPIAVGSALFRER